jgi:hypothetical protein
VIDWRRFMGTAIAHMGWCPTTFWRATMHEYQSAAEALRASEPKGMSGGG